MIWTVLSIVVCVVICVRLMFFNTGNEHHQSIGLRWLALLTTIYAGSRVINHLYSVLDPTRFIEFVFNATLLVLVLYFGQRSRKQIRH